MLKLIVFDIDGVLTDGTVQIDENGCEYKKFLLNDIDALNQIVRDGINIAAITGENSLITECLRRKVSWKCFVKGCKKKLEAFQNILRDEACSLNEVAYVGDGIYDVQVLQYVPKSICPANAIPAVKEVAQIHLKSSGGHGCIVELYEMIKNGQI